MKRVIKVLVIVIFIVVMSIYFRAQRIALFEEGYHEAGSYFVNKYRTFILACDRIILDESISINRRLQAYTSSKTKGRFVRR